MTNATRKLDGHELIDEGHFPDLARVSCFAEEELSRREWQRVEDVLAKIAEERRDTARAEAPLSRIDQRIGGF